MQMCAASGRQLTAVARTAVRRRAWHHPSRLILPVHERRTACLLGELPR
jgi:hypothetical protein